MIRLLTLATLAWALAACRADLSQGTTSCDSAENCAVGETCYQQRCMKPGPDWTGPIKNDPIQTPIDAGPSRDSGPTTDVGGSDGGHGGSDGGAGLDAGPQPRPDAGLVLEGEVSALGCLDLLETSPRTPSGYYGFDLDGEATTDLVAYCDMDFMGGGWTELFRWRGPLNSRSQELLQWPSSQDMSNLLTEPGAGQLLIALRDRDSRLNLEDLSTLAVTTFPSIWGQRNPFSEASSAEEVRVLSGNARQSRIHFGRMASGPSCSTFEQVGGVLGKICLEDENAPAFLNWSDSGDDCCASGTAAAGVFTGNEACPRLCSQEEAYSLSVRASRGGADDPPYRDCAMATAWESRRVNEALVLDPDGAGSVPREDILCESDQDSLEPGWTLVYKRHYGHGNETPLCNRETQGRDRERLADSGLVGDPPERSCASAAMMARHKELRCYFRTANDPVRVEYQITSNHTVKTVLQDMTLGPGAPDGEQLTYTCSIDGIAATAEGTRPEHLLLPCQVGRDGNLVTEYSLYTGAVVIQGENAASHFNSDDFHRSGHCYSR